MREILFKAKRLDNSEWVEGYYIYHIKRTPCVFGDSVKPEDEQHVIMCDGFSDWNMPRDTVYYDIDPETLCQYTGLTDKAKNKAFENSIIKLISENVFGVVKFGEYKSPFDNAETRHIGFYVDWENDDRCKFWRKDLGYWLNVDTVVIGNIFDNPELLENE